MLLLHTQVVFSGFEALCVSCRLRRHIYDACIDFICDDSSRPTRVTTSPEMFIGLLLFLYGAVEGFILPAPTVFGIRRGEWLRDSSLVIPRLTPDEIDALSTHELKKELRERGAAYSDCFEKSDLVFRLKKSIEHPESCKLEDHEEEDTNHIPTEEGENEVSEEQQNGEGRRRAVQKEVQLMKMKDIKAELLDRGVSTEGLFEKTEFVEVLANARLKCDTLPNRSSIPQEKEKAEEEERDPSYKDVQVTRMKKEPRQPSGPRNSGLGGNPFDAFRGGNPFGSGNPFGGGKNPFGL